MTGEEETLLVTLVRSVFDFLFARLSADKIRNELDAAAVRHAKAMKRAADAARFPEEPDANG